MRRVRATQSREAMNVRILIDYIVRHTTVLIAQLATPGGLPAGQKSQTTPNHSTWVPAWKVLSTNPLRKP